MRREISASMVARYWKSRLPRSPHRLRIQNRTHEDCCNIQQTTQAMKKERMESGAMTPADVDDDNTSLDEGLEVPVTLTEEDLDLVIGGVSQPCDLDW